MKQFEIGHTYQTRSACNHDCIFSIQVMKRTEKTVTYLYDGEVRRSKIMFDRYSGNEYIMPDRYSMAPVFRAEREIV